MVRPREFDKEVVLDKAVEVFWAKGYEATSIQDLVDAMGIQRGSMYAAFGGKHQLFLSALDRYGDMVVKKLLEILESQASAIESIELFFAQLVEHLLTAGPLRSCLVTNSAIERGLSDEDTKEKVLLILIMIEKEFYQTLLRAQNNGEITKDRHLISVAEYLTSSMQGLLVMGKVCSERSVLEGINHTTLSILR